ncbi:MAG: guanylate kinase [Dongiaceae bacterium]
MEEPARLKRRGLMLVLSSPSGAGKSTLTRNLLTLDSDLILSISVTTRPRRPSEVDGVHYHFIDAERFGRMRDGGELLEWAEVHGYLYATPRAPVETALAGGHDVLFDIDWQGTRQLAEAMPADIVRVFILPPSMAELRARLERRAEDAEAVINRRLANARSEIEHWSEYEYIVVNEDLQRSLGLVRSILIGERQKRERQLGLGDLVAGLLAEK